MGTPQGWGSRLGRHARLVVGTVAVAFLLVIGTARSSLPQTFTLLHSYKNGADPYGRLVRNSAGNLYGTTIFGRVHSVGTVFKVDASGNETVLYTFTGGTDGAGRKMGVVLDADGNLYGTTPTGGDRTNCPGIGCGVVYKIDRIGNETVLYGFTWEQEGHGPLGSVRDSAGNLYGTTYYGGSSIGLQQCPYGCGTVFELPASGGEKLLYNFAGGADGRYPFATVTLDLAGNLYGST